MDKDNMYLILTGLAFIGVLVYFTWSGVSEHENTHYTIASHFGCTNGTITHSIRGISYFICHDYSYQTEEQSNLEEVLHQTNEIVHYNLSSFGNSMIMCMALLGMILVLTRCKKDGDGGNK